MDGTRLSSAKLALLEKYRQGKVVVEKKHQTTIQKRPAGTLAPLSFGQQQMWLLAQLIPDVPVYNESVTVRLPGQLDIAALRQSVNEVIKRHEVWRTSFSLIDGELLQIVHPALELAIPFVDLRSLPLAEREPRAVEIATEQALPLFDLTTIPLLRATLIQLDDEDHRLYLTLHHILFDGVIYEVFLPELFAHYQACLAGKTSALPPLPVQYSDFALWQREQTQAWGEQLAYWKQRLATAPASLDLPTDHPRPLVQSHRGARLPFSLTPEMVNALKELAHSANTTLYQVLLSSFAILLYCYSGQTDLLIGSTTAGRKMRETQDLLGVFLNPLVIRTDLAGDPTFIELLARVRESVLGAYANQDVPFAYLVKELQPERNLRQSPFIQVMLSLEPPLPVLPSGWTITQSDVEAKTAKFDLFLELDDRPDGFAAWLEYSTDLFEEATARRMISHWQTLLQSILAAPTSHLTEFSFLTEEERQALLVTWNETTIDFPHHGQLQRLFELQAERSPQAVAAIFAHQKITYRELNARANQLARFLQQKGVGPEVLVGIYTERSLDMLVAVLGVLKAGGAYVPLDPAYPQERVAYMLQDSRARLVLTQQTLLSRLPQEHPDVVSLDTDWPQIACERAAHVENTAGPDDLAYIIYTSGSTGRPKGVLISHSAVTNLVQCMMQTLGVTSSDVVLGITTLAFDISVAEIFLPLSAGATLVVESRETIKDGSLLLKELQMVRPTLMQATPATWQMLLEAGLSSLKMTRIISTGEALEVSLREKLLACEPQSFWNLYGPTETTIWSTGCMITDLRAPVTIGRPLANTCVYVLDRSLQPVPVGVPGELYIGGTGLARGYLNQPELTAEKFVRNPFSSDEQSRLYRTGDLVHYRADGTLDYLGRLDQQVKLRGYRIELGEIEALLRQVSGVGDVVVMVREDVPGDKRLVAYITSVPGQSLSVSALQRELQHQLSDYMVPSIFMQLPAVPVTPSGKVDRRALPAPDPGRLLVEDDTPIASSVACDALQEIWAELLNTRIGIRDNFFLSGGHSLLAARLVAKIERTMGKKISLTTLITHPTIEQLAAVLEKQEDIESRSLILEIQPGEKTRRPFFFLHGDINGGAFYCFKLAQSLGKEQPFYACNPYRYAEGEPLPTMEEMAAVHLAAIRAMQPDGPYLLGGFCNGALLAYEMARQLHAIGQRVDLLFMVDPSPPAFRRWMWDVPSFFARLFRQREETELAWLLRLRYIFRYVRYPDVRRHYYKDMFESKNQNMTLALLKGVVPPPIEVLRRDWLEMYRWMMAIYEPSSPYPGKSTFVWTQEKSLSQMTWKRRPEMQTSDEYTLHCGHLDWVTQHLEVFGDVLRQSLEKVLPPIESHNHNTRML